MGKGMAAMLRRIFKRTVRLFIFDWELDVKFKLHRSRLKNHAVKTAMVVIPAALLYAGVTITHQTPHSFSSSDCFNCHFTIPQAGDAGPHVFVAPINELCTRECHDDLSGISHHVNTDETVAYETSFPVLRAEEITCATCHDPHMPATDAETGERTHLLKGGLYGKEECRLCHEGGLTPEGMTTRRPVMDTAHGVAHFTVNTSILWSYAAQDLDGEYPLGRLDRLTIFCLNCHDNPGNPELTTPGSEVYRHGPDNGLSHPIGVDYEEACSRNRELKLYDRDERLVLFDGRIGCCTCHDPYAVGGGVGLRIGERVYWQELCEGCHIR